MNPFPGMNPYLENPTLWRGVHQHLIIFMNGQLNRVLPEQYVARVEERVYISRDERGVYPDFAVYERPAPPARERSGASRGGAATLSRLEPGFVVRVEPTEVREPFIEVRLAREDEIVAIIELVSPANKADPTGRKEYRRKQNRLIGSDIHLLEVDLLRTGKHVLAVPETRVREVVSRWDYLVCLYRATRRFDLTFWPVTLQERLPVVPIPLTNDADDAPLDLQAALNRCYEEGAFDRTINYHEALTGPLLPDKATWMDNLLREQKLRP